MAFRNSNGQEPINWLFTFPYGCVFLSPFANFANFANQFFYFILGSFTTYCRDLKKHGRNGRKIFEGSLVMTSEDLLIEFADFWRNHLTGITLSLLISSNTLLKFLFQIYLHFRFPWSSNERKLNDIWRVNRQNIQLSFYLFGTKFFPSYGNLNMKIEKATKRKILHHAHLRC